jgi:hypothetical protein
MVHRLNGLVLLFYVYKSNVHRAPYLLTNAFHVRQTYYVFAGSKDSQNVVVQLPAEIIPVVGTHTRVTANGTSQHILNKSSS